MDVISIEAKIQNYIINLKNPLNLLNKMLPYRLRKSFFKMLSQELSVPQNNDSKISSQL